MPDLRRLTLVLCAAVAVADDAKRLNPDHAPTPYTAAEIRKACPKGRKSVFLIEAPRSDPMRQTFHFVACDEKGADIEITVAKGDGTPLGDPRRTRSTWKELQAHASYPEKDTKITEEAAVVGTGKYDCWLYTVRQDDLTLRLWFAKKLPGPPVRLYQEHDGEILLKMTLIEHSVPPPPGDDEK